MANGVVDSLFNRLPPAARHAVILIIVGFAIGTTYVTFDIRLSAAEAKAEEAKTLAAATAATASGKIEDVSRKVDKIDTAQQVMTQAVQNIKDAQVQSEARSTRIENKLDDLVRAVTRGGANGR